MGLGVGPNALKECWGGTESGNDRLSRSGILTKCFDSLYTGFRLLRVFSEIYSWRGCQPLPLPHWAGLFLGKAVLGCAGKQLPAM